MPAARSFRLLALATLLLVASFLDERLAWAALALDAAVAVAVVVDHRRAARTPPGGRAALAPPAGAGGAGGDRPAARHPRRRPVTAIVREGLHPGLAGGPLRRAIEIQGPGEIRWT